jgi:hypothetical protein
MPASNRSTPATCSSTRAGNSRPITAAVCPSARASASSRSIRAIRSASSEAGIPGAAPTVTVHARGRISSASSAWAISSR